MPLTIYAVVGVKMKTEALLPPQYITIMGIEIPYCSSVMGTRIQACGCRYSTLIDVRMPINPETGRRETYSTGKCNLHWLKDLTVKQQENYFADLQELVSEI